MFNKIKNKIIINLIIILTLILSSVTVTSHTLIESNLSKNEVTDDILSLLNRINESLISEYLNDLVSYGPRFTGTENCQESAKYIFNEFKSLGLNVTYHNWNSLQYNSQNVVATLSNENTLYDSIIILCAHYDTTKTSPGANDDGSGIATLLTIANIFSNLSFKHIIRFVAFSGEEIGTFGSHFYARDCYNNEDNIIAVINIDTVGYTTEIGGSSLYMLKSDRSQWISSLAINISRDYHQYLDINIKPISNRRNDHQSFLEYGYDAIQFVQLERGEYPMHTPDDTIDKINFTYLTKVNKLILTLSYFIANNDFETQVLLTNPKEGYLYVSNNPVYQFPGFNIRNMGLRGMTYLIGDTVAKIDILTNENITSVAFCLDSYSSFSGFLQEPPYEWKIEKPFFSIKPIWGKHVLSVYVTTESGFISYDEMDIFIIFSL